MVFLCETVWVQSWGHSSLNFKMIPENGIIWSHILAYNILRWHILNAAIIFGSHIENISIKTAARVVVANKTAILMSQQLNRPALFAALYEQMTSVPVGNRPGRSEPRAVKKRPKPYPRLQGRRNDWKQRATA